MWFAIAVTVLAAAGNNIGKVLQKQATRTLPRLTLKQDVVSQYLRSRTWVIGLAVDVAGALLMIVAFAQAPVSVVQPVSGIGLVILLVFSHFYLKERLHAHEWGAAAAAGLGILGLGLSSEPSHLDHPNVSATRMLGGFMLMVAALGLECWWRQRWYYNKLSRLHLGSTPSPQWDAAMSGLEAGACFGFSAAACRTGFLLAVKISWVWIPLGLAASIVLTTSGFVMQTRGLKSGNTIVVCTMTAVSSMLSGVLAGLVALSEHLPSTPHMQLTRVVSWLLLLLGVTSLSGLSKPAAKALGAKKLEEEPLLPVREPTAQSRSPKRQSVSDDWLSRVGS